MLKRILIILIVCVIGSARADEFFIGGSVGLLGPGMVVGWEADQNFGVRLTGGTVWGQGVFLTGDVYAHWKFDKTRLYAGGGVVVANVLATTYIAPEILLGLSGEIAKNSELFLELNPGFAGTRIPPLPADTFEYFPAVELAIILRLNLGYRFRF
jgi:hypothetical protein